MIKPGNSVIYYPNRILRGLEPWEGMTRTRNPFAWIGEALKSTEQDVIAAGGVDAAVYFVFLSTTIGILTLSGIVLLPVLLPVAATDTGIRTNADSNSNGTFSNLDKFAMGNVKNPLVAITFLSSQAGYVVPDKIFRKYCSVLRATSLASSEAKPEQFAVLVRDLPQPPKGQTQKELVDSYFRKLHPNTFYRSLVVTNIKEANKIWKEIEGYRKKLARAEAVFAVSKTSSKPEGTKPTNRTGFLGLTGKKVDTIDFCNEKIKELVPKLEAEQEITIKEKQQRSAIVFFNSRIAAASAAQTLHAQMVDHWTVTEAPEPCQLIWTNLPIKFWERQIREKVVYVIVFLTIVFYMIPIAFVSAFTTLKNLRKVLSFLKVIVDIAAVKTILEAYLPQIFLIVFLALLPRLLLFLSKTEGIPSQSHIERAASGKFFYFVVFNVFIGITVGGTLLTSLKTILKSPSEIISMLGKSLPKNATFFLTFVALKFFVGYGLELSRLVPLIIFHLKRKYLCKTEAEVKEAWAPGDLGFATRIPNDMLIITITLCYSVIAPLIIPFGVVYFGLGWLILRNQALKVYVPKYESYGRMWPHIHVRVIAALVLYQLTMIGYFAIKKFYYAPFLLPLLIFSALFAFVSNKRFYPGFQSVPLEVVSQPSKDISPNLEYVFAAYVPPCLGVDKYSDSQSVSVA
ncbi:CSC1-like protein erd4 [Asimina triloba]